jgi:hypothetical protein
MVQLFPLKKKEVCKIYNAFIFLQVTKFHQNKTMLDITTCCLCIKILWNLSFENFIHFFLNFVFLKLKKLFSFWGLMFYSGSHTIMLNNLLKLLPILFKISNLFFKPWMCLEIFVQESFLRSSIVWNLI